MEGETTRGRNDSGRNDSRRTGKWAKRPVTVYDTVAENGEFYTFEQLKVIYNIRGTCTFLDNQRMLNNISQSWKAQVNDNRVFIFENKHNVLCNICVKK